ncbi:photosystem reaction center subunit H [Rhizobium sp. Root274]|uniref:PRC-barrel domain-containing protein n=1 Tax=unclassified Rhizobium TaxID=2613769 RepID=UPI00071478CA|nr:MULTISPECIES: PRC-barrel domain-containing protein [unclassified Rhizobium]KQW31526.1 photosystem reaction center subunit H [Rhizobium sp. Root1240]KRD33067.1 photosystem reaction center subunit H [Rhizobium sp. Root274]
MKKTLTTIAAAMLLGSTAMAPVAFAQDATGTTTTTPPATTAPVSPDASGGTTDATGATGTMGSNSTVAPNTTADAAAGSGTYLTEQAENQISVNDFMGQAIYTADNQSIGDINDLLVQNDGGVVAAIVGVGGFLGIGEKNVAIPFDKITITRETASGDAADAAADGDTKAEVVAEAEIRLTTTETAESLKNAPEFRTLDDQADDADSAATTTGTTGTGMPADGTTTSSTNN